jgi:hypothetical protein
LRDARWDVAGGVKVIHYDETLQVVRFQWRKFCSMERRLGALKRKVEREMGFGRKSKPRLHNVISGLTRQPQEAGAHPKGPGRLGHPFDAGH